MDYSYVIAQVEKYPFLKKGIDAFLEEKKGKGQELSEEGIARFHLMILQSIPKHARAQVKGEGQLFRFFANSAFYSLLGKY